MDTLIHADIFFFISTIALVIISIGIIIALVFVIKILRDLSQISKKVKEEGIEILQDVRDLRGEIKREGFTLWKFISMFGSAFLKRRTVAKSSREKKSEDSTS